ncbi:MAG TPA: PAS domain S-box protein [Polyangiales bacterium]|nr:PAS domain S-box protein [Polyangiales bacterium]
MLALAEGDEPLQVLLAEDNEGDVRLIERALRNVAPGCKVHAVDNGIKALAFLRRGPDYPEAPRPDVVLLDLKLPRKSGLEVLGEMKREPALRRIPVVVLSSSRADHDIARAYELQATAYIAKPVSDYREVIESIVRFLSTVERPHFGTTPPTGGLWDDTDGFVRPVESESPSSPSQARLMSAIVECSPDAIFSMDKGGIITAWNAAAERLFGSNADDVLGKHIRAVLPDDRLQALEATVLDVQRNARPSSIETVRVDRGGRRMAVSLTVSPLTDADGRPIGSLAMARDVTERKRTEEKVRLAVEAAPTAMIMVDEAGTMLLVNTQAERLFGYSRGELVGRSIDMLVPARQRGEHRKHRTAFSERPETRSMASSREIYGLRRDGTEVPIEIGLTPIITQDGLVVLSSIVDISERRQAEERFRLAVDSSPNGMIMVNARGDMVLVNTEASRMFGYSRDELVGHSIEMLVPQRLRGLHVKHRTEFGARPERRAMGAGRELHGVRKSGSEFPIEIGLNPISTPQGPLVLCSIVDITERKLTQESLEARSRELLRSNAELEQFAYVASHDLQEPLRMVASYTSLLAEEYGSKLDDDARLYIHFAKEGAERMQQLIHDLLSYSRISSRKRPPTQVSASECLDLALANLRISLDETGCVVRRSELPALLGDKSQLVDLFQNLVANAIKFRRGVPPVIEVSAETFPGGVKFSVRDNGIGMEPQYFEDVFQVFRRLHTKEEYPGTGIGLAICKRIVERVGGRIWVESVLGQGSTFHFTWPAPAAPKVE